MSRRILIVSDEQIENEMLETLFDIEGGYEVSIATNFEMGLKYAQLLRPDVLLVDYSLGDGLGTDLIRQLRQKRAFRSVPVILVTGLPVEDEAIAAGADRFVMKPYEPTALIALISELLVGSNR